MVHLVLFVVLQGCDLVTTLCFLHAGIAEGNPLIAALLRLSGPPAFVLSLVKAAACGLAWLAWRRGSVRLLRRVNLLFALCVAWNLTALAKNA